MIFLEVPAILAPVTGKTVGTGLLDTEQDRAGHGQCEEWWLLWPPGSSGLRGKGRPVKGPREQGRDARATTRGPHGSVLWLGMQALRGHGAGGQHVALRSSSLAAGPGRLASSRLLCIKFYPHCRVRTKSRWYLARAHSHASVRRSLLHLRWKSPGSWDPQLDLVTHLGTWVLSISVSAAPCFDPSESGVLSALRDPQGCRAGSEIPGPGALGLHVDTPLLEEAPPRMAEWIAVTSLSPSALSGQGGGGGGCLESQPPVGEGPHSLVHGWPHPQGRRLLGQEVGVRSSRSAALTSPRRVVARSEKII